jgi:hypothetical protein
MNREHTPSMEEIDELADAIAVAAATMDSAMHELLSRIRRFDEQKGWARQGAKSCAHWLSWRIGLGTGAAREKVRVARALGELPLVDAELRAGRISYAKVRAITRVATRANEAMLCKFAQGSTGAQLERICRGLRQVERLEEGGRPNVDDEERFVRQRHLPSGLVRIEIQLLPDEAARVLQAVRAAQLAQSPDASENVPAGTSGQRVDAVVAVAESYLGSTPIARTGGERTQLFVHLSEERAAFDGSNESPRWSAVLADGTWISGATLLRLACDTGIVVATKDAAGRVLDVGRKTRTVPAAILRALWLRDGHCRFPGCSSRIGLEAHHAVHWAHGGETSRDNLMLVCEFHHVALHEEGFTARVENGAFLFYDPRGRSIPAVPAPRPVTDGLDVLSQCCVARGVAIDHKATIPIGWGQPLDRHAAVSALSRLG